MAFRSKANSAAVLILTFSSALSAAPRLGLSTATVGPINTTPGANGPTQTVEAFNLGDGALNPSAISSASWLAVTVGSQKSCTTRSGNCYPVSILLNTASLAAGTYTEYVTVTDANAIDSPQDIAVTINNAGVPGSLTVYAQPANGVTGSDLVFPVYTTGAGVTGTASTQSGGNWLRFSSGSNGLTPSIAPWLIEVSPLFGQAAGTYNGSVVISGSSAASDNKTVNVVLNITTSPIVDTGANTQVRLVSFPGGPTQYSIVTLNNLGQGTLTLSGATANSSNKFLSASVSSPTSILISASTAGLSSGTFTGSVTIASNAANNSQISIPVEFVVTPAGQPLISAGGIVNAANGAQEPVSQGDIAAIYGNQLAAAGTAVSAASTPLMTTLGGSQVLVNGVPAPLFYVSPSQINFQLPYSLPAGQLATVQVVSNGSPGDIRSLSINNSSPRLLLAQGNYGAIVNSSDGSLTLPAGALPKSHPAKPGDVITIYAIGFGQTNPAATEGQPSSSTTLQTVSNATVSFGGGFIGGPAVVNAAFAGLTPTAVGLYQINVAIPSLAPLGSAVPVTVGVGSVQSNVVYVAISATGQ